MSRFYTHGGESTPMDDFSDRGYSRSQTSYNNYDGSSSKQPLNQYYDEDKEQGFDVRADFDGAGPRWSEMHGVAKHETYRPVYDHDAEDPGQIGAVRPHLNQTHRDPEMVSVPVLGAEWTKDELHGASKRGKADEKRYERKTNFRAWNRDQRGCCGIPWLTRTIFVFLAFFFLAALAVTLYFVIPRTVAFSWFQDDLMDVQMDTLVVNRVPTNFSFDANLHLLADTTTSWIPVQFSNAKAKVYDQATSELIATGSLGSYKMPHAKDIPVRFPVTFKYSALNTSDPTWVNMYQACRFPVPGVERADLKFRLEIQQYIVGMVTHPYISTTILGAACPFNISNSV